MVGEFLQKITEIPVCRPSMAPKVYSDWTHQYTSVISVNMIPGQSPNISEQNVTNFLCAFVFDRLKSKQEKDKYLLEISCSDNHTLLLLLEGIFATEEHTKFDTILIDGIRPITHKNYNINIPLTFFNNCQSDLVLLNANVLLPHENADVKFLFKTLVLLSCCVCHTSDYYYTSEWLRSIFVSLETLIMHHCSGLGTFGFLSKPKYLWVSDTTVSIYEQVFGEGDYDFFYTDKNLNGVTFKATVVRNIWIPRHHSFVFSPYNHPLRLAYQPHLKIPSMPNVSILQLILFEKRYISLLQDTPEFPLQLPVLQVFSSDSVDSYYQKTTCTFPVKKPIILSKTRSYEVYNFLKGPLSRYYDFCVTRENNEASTTLVHKRHQLSRIEPKKVENILQRVREIEKKWDFVFDYIYRQTFVNGEISERDPW